jgi:acetyl esterase/lipase
MPRIPVFLLVVLTGATGRAAVTPEQLLELPVPPGSTRVAYGTDSLQFGELRVPPDAGPHPVAVLVHGGCWAARLPGRDPRISIYELLRPLAAELSRAGVATWNVEYRRAGNSGGGWPGTFLDLSSAMDFLPQVAAGELDLKRIIVVGHSAGGQLALWLAARARVPRSSPIAAPPKIRIQAAIDVDGPPDLLEAQGVEHKLCGRVPAVTEFLGGPPTQHPERYRDGSSSSFLPLGVRQVLVKAELLAIPGLLDHYVERARAAKDDVTVVDLAGADHFEMFDPGSPHGRTLVEVIVRAAHSR